MTSLRVNEVFRCVQGEGPRLGTPSVFVRLHGCPVKCGWCDTAYTFDGSEPGREVELSALLDEVRGLLPHSRHVVVTGGEPTVQGAAFVLLIDGLINGIGDVTVEVETAGIAENPLERKWPGLPFDHCYLAGTVSWNLSPKMPSAAAKVRPDLDVLRSYTHRWGASTECMDCGADHSRVELKLVVADGADLDAAVALAGSLKAPPEHVWLMPCGDTREAHAERLAWLIDEVQRREIDCRVTPRMHVAAFGKRRGV